MKHILVILCFLSLSTFAISNDTDPKPEKIHYRSEIEKSGEYYIRQAALWETVLKEDKTNANAWLNYFMASRYARSIGRQEGIDLNQIAEDAWAAVPNTFEGHYLMYARDSWNEENRKYLEKAYEIAPDRSRSYHSFCVHYEMERNTKKVKEFIDKLYEARRYSNGLLAWNYNVLQSVGEDGILISWGDNDTYPIWMLQYGKNIRTDVSLLNINLLSMKDYADRILPELGIPKFTNWTGNEENIQALLTKHVIENSKRPVYINVTTHHTIKDPFKDDLYLTGLTYLYSTHHFDNIATLKKNIENKFAMDYVNVNLGYEKEQEIVNQINMSYLPSLMLLYKHYVESEDKAKAEKLKSLMLKIAKDADNMDFIERYFTGTESNIRTYPELNIKKLEKQYVKVDGVLMASSSELTIGDYDQFLMDLVKNREFDKLAICKVEKTDWRSFLSEEHKKLSDAVIFQHGHPDEARMPIQNISYEAAKLYCEWLTGVYNNSTYKKKKYENVVFRLPTEKEWEKAARAGHEASPFPWGGYYHRNIKGCYLSNMNVTDSLPCTDCENQASANDGGFFTVYANSYFPNDFGCFGMSGNVAEMTSEKGLAKGGSWLDSPSDCQINSRNRYTDISPSIGFRVFMEIK